jgi:hypothetical protein
MELQSWNFKSFPSWIPQSTKLLSYASKARSRSLSSLDSIALMREIKRDFHRVSFSMSAINFPPFKRTTNSPFEFVTHRKFSFEISSFTNSKSSYTWFTSWNIFSLSVKFQNVWFITQSSYTLFAGVKLRHNTLLVAPLLLWSSARMYLISRKTAECVRR